MNCAELAFIGKSQAKAMQSGIMRDSELIPPLGEICSNALFGSCPQQLPTQMMDVFLRVVVFDIRCTQFVWRVVAQCDDLEFAEFMFRCSMPLLAFGSDVHVLAWLPLGFGVHGCLALSDPSICDMGALL